MELFITEKGKASAFIGTTVKQARTLEANLHRASVMVAVHGIVHGDNSLATRLLSGLDNGKKNALRNSALKQWLISDLCPFYWGKVDKLSTVLIDKDKAAKLKAAYEANPDDFIENLCAVPYFVENKEAEFKGYDFNKVLAQAVAKAEKMLKEYPDDSKVKVDTELLAKVKAITVAATVERVKGTPLN